MYYFSKLDFVEKYTLHAFSLKNICHLLKVKIRKYRHMDISTTLRGSRKGSWPNGTLARDSKIFTASNPIFFVFFTRYM